MDYFEFYSAFGLEDFVEDPEFREWVFSPTETGDRFWRDYSNQYPEQQEILEEARSFLFGTKLYFTRMNRPEKQIDKQLSSLLRKKYLKEADKKVVKLEGAKKSRYRIISIAATLLCLLFALGWYFFPGNQSVQTYTTSYGEWKQVELPDGSKVDLNANSELKIGKDWSASATRRVWLKGEAFFEIEKKPDTGSKFQVFTDGMAIEVLGTSFNVHNRNQQTEVFLKEGLIKLNIGEGDEYLEPGDFLAFSAREKKIIGRNSVSQEVYTSWREGVIEMIQTPIGDVFDKVQEIYGVTFEIADLSILTEERTVALPMKNLEMVIPILEWSLDVKISREGDKLIIK